MNLELMIARRYLRARGSRFVSVITLISVGGVALGVVALITVLAVMSGFQEEVRSRIVGTNAHLMVMRLDREPVKDYAALVEGSGRVPGVVAATPFIYGKGLVSLGTKAEGAVIRGVCDSLERRATRVMDYVRPTGVDLLAREGELPRAILGRELAYSLGGAPGDTVLVTTIPEVEQSALGPRPHSEPCMVVGIFDSGMYDFDASLLLVPLETAQRLVGMGEGVTGVAVRVDDLYRAEEIGDSLVAALGVGTLTAVDWMQLNPNLFSWMKMEKVVMFLLLILIVLVAAFNIASTLIMMVLEKTRDIGVLKAMGATRERVRRVFVWEGLLIGGAGTLIGVIGGLLLCFSLSRYRFISLPADVYFLDKLPIHLEISDILITAGAAVTISLLATLYPSHKAASSAPVDAIRSE